ncbi:hypothetical protein MSAN_00244000 [Mycena sanguinolenta]|uniref:Uncharacterized protein n=1 Tax=Mycena sanguinolenta TaxID=230812 RepID=A0A8H6ZIL2_9AGAR|nr:hypothetical protein MSAN_00244000 [Mycena sanguinolenta]
MVDDLADLTPRRFLRHPILKSFLRQELPHLVNPTLADWHVSLANREHVKSYIKQAQEVHYPFGTGWKGVINLKSYQDARLPKEHHYIRRTLALPLNSEPTDSDEDEEISPQARKDDRLRIIVCMTPEASRRLLASGRYLQSDIGFRRIIGFKEFEVAGMERDANTSIIYCRIYLNRMTAQAHQRVFEEIEAIVFEDTGKRLQWHHLHATDLEDGLDCMILSWTADQHRGQEKVSAFTFRNSLLLCRPSQTCMRANDCSKTYHHTSTFIEIFVCALCITSVLSSFVPQLNKYDG